MADIAIRPTLNVIEGKPTTTSNEVAQHFGKQHKHVLDKIAALLADLPPEFAGPNFRLSEFTDSTGRTLPAYRLTRDGFTLLAMGFTGKKALTFKLAYIDAFNQMEATLHGQAITLAPAQKRELQKAITSRAYELPAYARSAEFARIYRALKDHFNVSSYAEIPAQHYTAALAFLDTIAPVNSIQSHKGEPAITLTPTQASTIAAFIKQAEALARAVRRDHTSVAMYGLAVDLLQTSTKPLLTQ